MNTWTPLWSQIVDSSLWEEPYFVRVLFTSMLAIKDVDFTVRMDTYKLSRRANMKEQEVVDGLKILCAPDRRRLGPQEHDGRRLKEIEGGWLILNAEKYRAMIKMVAAERKREANRLWMAKDRAKKKEAVVSAKYKGAESAYVKAYEAGDEEKCDRIAASGRSEG